MQALRAASAITLAGALTLGACSDEPVGRAVAELEPAAGSTVTGTVDFTTTPDGTRIEANLQGLDSGLHGLHIHENGDCSAPDASSAGGHFNPDDQPHGAPSDPAVAHHAGDLGNLRADENGEARATIVDSELTLLGEFGILQRSVIVHAQADDLESQPAGEAGARVACGVIESFTPSAPY